MKTKQLAQLPATQIERDFYPTSKWAVSLFQDGQFAGGEERVAQQNQKNSDRIVSGFNQ